MVRVVLIAWPAEVRIAPPPMRGRWREMPKGDEEGALCGQNAAGFATCLGKLEHERNPALGGCHCFTMRMPPCSSCMSIVPTCQQCGHRGEEP